MKHIQKIILFLVIFSPLIMIARKAKKHSPFLETHIDLPLPEGFGKTHFIIGFPQDAIDSLYKKAKKELLEGSTEKKLATKKQAVIDLNKRAFFSPDDDIQEALIACINKEMKSINIAIFTFTDNDIAQALVNAHKRGVSVTVVTDPAQMRDRYSKMSMLVKEGIKVYEYNPDYIQDKRSNLMHHKFVVFGSPATQDSFVWTGSFNFTQAARKRNQENVVLVKDKEVVDQYLKQFDLLKQRCVGCKNKVAIA